MSEHICAHERLEVRAREQDYVKSSSFAYDDFFRTPIRHVLCQHSTPNSYSSAQAFEAALVNSLSASISLNLKAGKLSSISIERRVVDVTHYPA